MSNNLINRDAFIAWIKKQQDEIISSLGDKSLSSNPRKQEKMKTLNAVLETLDKFDAECTFDFNKMSAIGGQALKDKRHKFFTSGDGKRALTIAYKMKDEGNGYMKICNELERLGIRTLNNRPRWNETRLMKTMKEFEERKAEFLQEDSHDYDEVRLF